MKKYFILSALAMMLTACGNSQKIKTDPGGDQSGVGSGDISELSTYEMLDEGLFAPRCTICHTPGHFSGVDTSTYEGLIDSDIINNQDPLNSLLITSITSGFMPLRGPRIPTDSEIFMLLEGWVLSGAKKFD